MPWRSATYLVLASYTPKLRRGDLVYAKDNGRVWRIYTLDLSEDIPSLQLLAIAYRLVYGRSRGNITRRLLKLASKERDIAREAGVPEVVVHDALAKALRTVIYIEEKD